MSEVTINDEENAELFKSAIDKMVPFTKMQILRYYDEKDIIPIIRQMEDSGVDIAKVKSFELIQKFEENRIPKKQKFASWMLSNHGRPQQPQAKI